MRYVRKLRGQLKQNGQTVYRIYKIFQKFINFQNSFNIILGYKKKIVMKS